MPRHAQKTSDVQKDQENQANTKLSIVIPAKNEAKRIKNTLNWYCSFFSDRFKKEDIEIVVVINNTDDKTASHVRKYSKKYGFVRKIITPYASGKGGAVALGFEKAAGEHIGFTDADGAVPPSEFYKLYKFLEETPWLDGAVGKRNPDFLSFKRKFLYNFYNFITNLFFNLPFKDVQCGAKVFRRESAKKLGSRVSNIDWAFDINLLLLAKYLNLRVKEYEVDWKERAGSHLTFFEGTFLLTLSVLKLKKVQVIFDIKRRWKRLLNIPQLSTSEGRKNILIYNWRDVKHPEMGGAEVYIHNIAKRLAKKDNVFFFTSQPQGLDDEDIIDNIRIIRRGGRFTVYLYGFLYYLIFFRRDMDVILDVENGVPFFTPLFSLKPKILVLHHVHGKQWFKELFFPVALIGFLIEKYLMPLVYFGVPVVTTSPSSIEEVVALGFNERRVFISYPYISRKLKTKVEKSPYPLLLYLGRIKSYKRIELGIIALREVLKDYPRAKFFICGSGNYTDELKNLAKKFNMEKSVLFKGFVSEKQKWEYFKEAWIHLLPSIKEGWGMTIIEAGTCGTPTVGFDVGGVRDSVVDEKTGLLAVDIDDFIRKIVKLIENEELREELGENAEKWAEVFSWDRSAAVYSQLISFVAGNKELISKRIYPWELDIRSDTSRFFSSK